MTDDKDLIAMARLAQRDGRMATGALYGDLADRIEDLIAELSTCEKYRDAYAEMGRIGTQAVRDLEAKLAKAEGALSICSASWGECNRILDENKAKLAKAEAGLREIAAEASVPVHTWKNGINFKKMYEGWRKIAVERIDIARATLAEIKGESHE